jgi:hypothetical protein
MTSRAHRSKVRQEPNYRPTLKKAAAAGMATLVTLLSVLLCAPPARALLPPEQPAGPQVRVHVGWTQQYLCLAAKVDDTMLTGTNTGAMSAPEQDDAVEFCLAVPTRGETLGYRLAISAAGGMNLLKRDARGDWRADPSWISGPRTLKYAVATEGTLGKPRDKDVGFTAECAIPWEFLSGAPPSSAMQVGFNVICWMQGENEGMVSWSRAVTSEDQIGDISRWGVMLAAPNAIPGKGVGSVVSCPYLNETPFIDGKLQAQEWISASTLSFAKPAATFSPAPVEAPGIGAPGLLLALYRYDWEGDPARPGAQLWGTDGFPATVDQPMEAPGPWYSYRWVSWHRAQLEAMQGAGIDVVLARYRGDDESRKTWAVAGLDRMTQALKELRAEGKRYPLVGMLLDTGALQGVDLKDGDSKALLYGMIREFYLHVPPEFRAQLGARPQEGTAGGLPVLLGDPQGLGDWDASFLGYCQQRFGQDFGGARITWLGSSAWRQRGAEGFYAYVRVDGRSGLTQEQVGGASAVSISPGYCRPSPGGEIRSRRERRAYRTDWDRVLALKPELIVINSWNDFSDATEIAPTRQYGYGYADLTELSKARLGGEQAQYVRLKQASAPQVLRPGAEYQVELVVENVGTQEVRTGREITADHRLLRRSDNTVVREELAAQELRLRPGETRRLMVGIKTTDNEGKPLPPGQYLFSLAVMKSGVSYLRSKWLARPIAELTVPIVVGEPPSLRATVISTSLPCLMESGATEEVVVRLRNDGSATWRKAATRLSYHWVKFRDELRLASADARDTVASQGAAARLPRDVAPGEVVSVTIPVRAARDDGSPLPPEGDGEPFHYRVQWDVADGGKWASHEGGSVDEEAIEIVARDSGVLFRSAATPAEMDAGATAQVEVAVANAGPRPWLATDTALIYHWYRWDGAGDGPPPQEGAPAQTALPRDLPAGETAVLRPQLTAPALAGMYWLVWDLVREGEGASQRDEGRRNEFMVSPVLVKGGRFRPLDLSSLANVVAVTTDSYRARGDIDGRGHSLPAECLPPDLSGARADLYPSGYYAHQTGQPVPFAFPDAGSGVGRAVACRGQSVPLGGTAAKRAHLLVVNTGETSTPQFGARTPTGVVALSCSGPVRNWREKGEAGAPVGAYVPYLRGLSGDEATTGGYLPVIVLDLPEGATSLALPDDPALKVVAITAEDQ